MSGLEILVAVLSIAFVLWIFVSGTASKRRFAMFAVLLVLIVVQISFDGARWQMLPMYLLVCLSGIYLLYRNKVQTKRRTWRVVLSLLLVSVLSLIALALPAVLPVFQFQQPTGSYPVGTKTEHLRGANQETMIQFWYPAEENAGGKPAPYIRDVPEVTRALSEMMTFPGFIFRHLEHVETNAYADAALSAAEDRYPVILFSHGLGGIRNQNTFQAEELASHGYIVIGIDYPAYAAATVFPNGETIRVQHANLVGSGIFELDQHIDYWADYASFVLDQLENLNRTDWLHQAMDLERIAMLGHSYGGAVSTYMLQMDERVTAALNMDGGLFGLGNHDLSDKPLFLMATASSLDIEDYFRLIDALTEEELELMDKSKEGLKTDMNELMARRERAIKAGASSLVIEDSSHISFSDLPLYAPRLLSPQTEPEDLHRVINQYSLAFFDYFLKGRTDSFEQISSAPSIRFSGPYE